MKHSFALSKCIAHTLCKVTNKVDAGNGHWLLTCTQVAAWCRSDYFDGKRFLPKNKDLSPYMTFLGSKTFGYVHGN